MKRGRAIEWSIGSSLSATRQTSHLKVGPAVLCGAAPRAGRRPAAPGSSSHPRLWLLRGCARCCLICEWRGARYGVAWLLEDTDQFRSIPLTPGPLTWPPSSGRRTQGKVGRSKSARGMRFSYQDAMKRTCFEASSPGPRRFLSHGLQEKPLPASKQERHDGAWNG